MKISGAGAVEGEHANRIERQLQPERFLKTGFPLTLSLRHGTTATLHPSNPSSDDGPTGKHARVSMQTDRSLVERPAGGVWSCERQEPCTSLVARNCKVGSRTFFPSASSSKVSVAATFPFALPSVSQNGAPNPIPARSCRSRCRDCTLDNREATPEASATQRKRRTAPHRRHVWRTTDYSCAPWRCDFCAQRAHGQGDQHLRQAGG